MKTQALGPFLLWRKVMELCLSFKVRLLRIFGAIKVPKVQLFAIHNNSRSELVFVRTPLNAKYSSFIVLMRTSLVVEVFTHICFAKICDSIISWVAVNVVYKFCGPSAIDVKPCKTVRLVSGVSNGYVPPTFATVCPGDVARQRTLARNSPFEYSGFRIVREKVSQVLGGQFFFYNTSSHDDSFKVRLVRACVAVQTPHRLVQFTGVSA